jgi:hypothetical protein
MSTRAQVRFAERKSGQSFAEQPKEWHAQFYVHYDGYPEGLGVDIASSIFNGTKIMFEIQDLDEVQGDIEYLYYVWQAPGKPTFISIFEKNFGRVCELCEHEHPDKWECIFVGEPRDLIKEYTN